MQIFRVKGISRLSDMSNGQCLLSERKIVVKICRHLVDNFAGDAFHLSSLCQINWSEMKWACEPGVLHLWWTRELPASCPTSSPIATGCLNWCRYALYCRKTAFWLYSCFIVVIGFCGPHIGPYTLPISRSTLLWSDVLSNIWMAADILHEAESMASLTFRQDLTLRTTPHKCVKM